MTNQDKEKVIIYLFDTVFLPDVCARVSDFMVKKIKEAETCTQFEIATGSKVLMNSPNILDLSEPAKNLLRNILTALKENETVKQETEAPKTL